MSKKSNESSRPNAVNFTVWTMNGSPMPEQVRRRVEGAIVAIIKDSESRTRLLHTVTVE